MALLDELQNGVVPDLPNLPTAQGQIPAVGDVLDQINQHVDMNQKIQDMMHKQQNHQRRDKLLNMLSTFLFSVGQGLSVPPQVGGNGMQAAGAALQGPFLLQQMRQQQADRQAQQQAQMMQARAALQNAGTNQMNAQSLGAYRQMIPVEIDDKGYFRPAKDPANAVMSMPASQIGTKASDFLRSKATQEATTARAEMRAGEADARLDKTIKAKLGMEKFSQDFLAGEHEKDRQLKRDALEAQNDRAETQLKFQQDKERALENYRSALLDLRRGSLSLSSDRYKIASANLANKVYDPALSADTRLRAMIDSAGKAYQGTGGQSDLQLLYNHIGMTLSAQKGARITNAEIDRAVTTAGEGETTEARAAIALYNKVKTGQGFLTPPQRKQMVENAINMRENLWDRARREAITDGLDYEPPSDTSLPKIGNQSVAPLTPRGAPKVTKPSTADDYLKSLGIK